MYIFIEGVLCQKGSPPSEGQPSAGQSACGNVRVIMLVCSLHVVGGLSIRGEVFRRLLL